MKMNYRSRKVVLDSIKGTEAPKAQLPSRLAPSRFILRTHKKQDETMLKPTTQELLRLKDSPQKISNKIESNIKQFREETQFSQTPTQYLEARDRRTILKYDFIEKRFNLDQEKERLNEWLGEMHFKVVSSSFNLYLSQQLTFQEVKVHCCQNLLLNLLNFLESLTQNSDNSLYNSRAEREHLSYIEMTQILKHINDVLTKNLAYMQIKYPLTKDSKPNKALQSLITKINNLGNDEHDIIMKSKVKFQLKQKGNYTSQIMKFINFLITKQTQLCGIKGNNKKELTYFEYFYETIQRIFTSVYKPDFNTKQQQKQKQAEDPAAIFAKIISQGTIDIAEPSEGKTKQEKQYKEKVMKYTHYLIGQKVSSNTESYSDKQVQTQIFDVKNSSILRILTKWTQQLENKIMNAQEQILKRPFRFKRNVQSQFSKLNANQKNDLYQEANRRAKEVSSFNEQLKQNYNEIESMLSSHLRQGPEYKHIPKNQYKVGFFCSKIQAAASSTLLSYLNKIIHILLLIPQQLKNMHVHDEEYIENININLITFKISDLFRCKIKSREAQIIRIFRQIKSISQKGQPFKIVRIKDRLNQGTRDIMVNILFQGIFLCEIQLAIEDNVDTKQKSYDSFSHFLYEMHRSRLGPIMESACTWSQFDQRVRIFRQINDSSGKMLTFNVEHGCDKEFFITNQYPFVCTLCQKFYSTQIGLIEHKKCVLCKAYYECSVCLYNKMSQKEISQLLGIDQLLGIFKSEFRLWNFEQQQQKHRKFPLFGLIISKKMKKPQVIFFQTVIFKYDAYIIQLKYNPQQSDKVELIVIEKIVENTVKQIRSISQKYIIYEWIEERKINNKIMPENMKHFIEGQKAIRQQIAKDKKAEKQKKKLELNKKRQQEQQRIAKFLRRGDPEKEKQQKQKEAKKQKQNQSSDESGSDGPMKQQDYRIAKFNENIFKRNEYLEVRIIEKFIVDVNETLVLGIFLKEYIIRNKLKKMNNQNILQTLSTRKIEVLFMEDEFIHDQINNFNDLTEIQLQQLKETFEGITQVYFDNNYIDSLDFLEGIVNLKVAHFSHNDISNLSAFQNLKQITQLILQNNKISDLTGLSNKKELVELNLNRNQQVNLEFFKNVENNDFGKLKNLYINDNQLQTIEGLDKLVNLVKLDLSFNSIEEIAPTSTLLFLEQLDLSGNNIKKMRGIGSYTNLKKLFLNNNDIIIITKEMSQLIKLVNLNLSGNKIKKIRNLNVGNFSKTLKILNLNDNKIQKMEGLDNLEALQQLYLSNNEIQSIDNYLDLTSLNTLDLSYNSIQELDIADIDKDLPCLKKFNISSNIINNTDANKSNLAYLNKLFGNIFVTFKKDM